MNILKQSIAILREALDQMPPAEAQAFLGGGIVANIVGPIGDEKWREMMHEATIPCGQIDCGCETLRGKVMEALDLQRTDWREQMRAE